LQIALVVNIGNAQATSGGNVVGAGPTGTNTTGAVKTGTVSAVGDQAKTGITQSAVVTNGDASSQDAMVINVGIAVGNSGLNITIGTIGSGAAATTSNTAIASVSSGAASATGDASKSTIIQAASGSATGTASLQIDQRAYIVNFGIAIANTGGNFALTSLDASSLTPEQQAVVQVLLQALAPLFGTASANGSSSVTTGSAKAVGTDATTTVSQNVRGVVSGDSAASAVQLAQVANIGFAVANSGLNGVGPAALGTDLAATQSSLDAFLGLLTNLDWLSGSNPSAQFAQTLNLGGLTVDLGGTLSANDMILGWDSAIAPDGGPLLTGVHVRQISAVLDIGFATADSGHNVVVAINGSAADATGNNVKLTRVTKKSSQRATIVTGNVVAVGNAATVTVCQAFNDGTACVVKTKTTLPGHKPEHAAPKPSVVRVAAITTRGASITASEVTVRPTSTQPAPASTLPFTGSDSTSLAELGLALLGLGAVLTRRRARDRSRGRSV
jgi:LPXTG-motif cell wall-anchored protein